MPPLGFLSAVGSAIWTLRPLLLGPLLHSNVFEVSRRHFIKVVGSCFLGGSRSSSVTSQNSIFTSHRLVEWKPVNPGGNQFSTAAAGIVGE